MRESIDLHTYLEARRKIFGTAAPDEVVREARGNRSSGLREARREGGGGGGGFLRSKDDSFASRRRVTGRQSQGNGNERDNEGHADEEGQEGGRGVYRGGEREGEEESGRRVGEQPGQGHHEGEDEPEGKGSEDEDEAGEEQEEGGAVLSLDEIPYDRDTKWYNKASSSRQRKPMSQDSIFFREIVSITHDARHEYQELDDHYKRLDKKKHEYDQRLGAAANKGSRGRGGRQQQRGNKDERAGREGKKGSGGVGMVQTPPVILKRGETATEATALRVAVVSNDRREEVVGTMQAAGPDGVEGRRRRRTGAERRRRKNAHAYEVDRSLIEDWTGLRDGGFEYQEVEGSASHADEVVAERAAVGSVQAQQSQGARGYGGSSTHRQGVQESNSSQLSTAVAPYGTTERETGLGPMG